MYKKPLIQPLASKPFAGSGLQADVLRLDMLHPEVSGNKWFKLRYHLAEAAMQGKKGLLSFGGAYSNHLVAMAYTCAERGLKSIGIIRGEAPATYGPSLRQMSEYGMELVFVSRSSYRNKNIPADYPDFHIVPEGGAGAAGVMGASEIMDGLIGTYSHVLCAVGTGTTLAGILNACHNELVVGISSLKTSADNSNPLREYLNHYSPDKKFQLLFDYHFGGYAKKTDQLLRFMNEFYQREQIPTDFVYTGKLFFALHDLVNNNFFPTGSKILVVHSGGLQGNRSLPSGTLDF